jgi:hypothetical protein
MSLIVEKPKRGRPVGSITNNVYKWEVRIFDKDTHIFKEGKCKSLADINKQFELNLTHDLVKRIETKFRADMNMRNKENSFLARWGHIQIKKINEKV